MRPSIDSAADGRAGELDGVAGAAGGADPADDGQHDVLGRDAAGELALDLDQHVLRLLGQQRLRRHHVLDLAGADAVRQRAERAVGGGVRVAADHGHAGQGGALLGPDHVDDALALGQERKVGGRAELADVPVQRDDLLLADRVGDAVVAALPAGGRRVVVGGGHDRADAPDLAAGLAQPFEGLRAGHFMDQVAVDVEDGGAVLLGVDDVLVPDLVVEGSAHGISCSGSILFGGHWLGCSARAQPDGPPAAGR